MFGYIEILRPGNCIMSAVAVFIGALLVMGGGNINLLLDFTSSYRIYLAMLVVFMITGAGNAINDYFDVESDRINRPRRPIPSGRVSVHGALLYASALFITGIILSGFINYFCFLIAAINSILLILYSKNLQNKILIGNLVIGYLVGSTFLFGGAAMKNLALPFWLFLLSMFSTISREIVKDIEDMEGDRKSFLKRLTYRIKKGIAERFRLGEGGIELAFEVKRARLLSFMALLTAVVISPVPYFINLLGLPYLLMLVPTNAVFVFSLFMILKSQKRKHFRKTSKLIKTGMNLGLLAFIVGVLF